MNCELIFYCHACPHKKKTLFSHHEKHVSLNFYEVSLAQRVLETGSHFKKDDMQGKSREMSPSGCSQFYQKEIYKLLLKFMLL